MSLKVEVLPVLSDNYIFLMWDTNTHEAVVVDPAECEPVLKALSSLANRPLKLRAIWNTHHHFDHVGGNLELKAQTGCEVIGFGPDSKRIPGVDKKIADKDELEFGGERFQVLAVPGHTRGHIAYYCESQNWLFCGDTLFSGGCGRLFEGTPEQMWSSLQKMKDLPDETLFFCAHEYTEHNLKFCQSVWPSNSELQKYLGEVQVHRQAGRFTIPASLGREKKISPFLAADHPDLEVELRAQGVQARAGVEVFAHVRRLRDRY